MYFLYFKHNYKIDKKFTNNWIEILRLLKSVVMQFLKQTKQTITIIINFSNYYLLIILLSRLILLYCHFYFLSISL